MGQEYSPSSAEKHCPRCNVLIKQPDPKIHQIERAFGEETDLGLWFTRVWHKACYDQDLEDGESLE